MTCDQADLWKSMINEDLAAARLSLVTRSDSSNHYLRHRIAEDEAILARLTAMEGSAHEFDVRAVGGRPV